MRKENQKARKKTDIMNYQDNGHLADILKLYKRIKIFYNGNYYS